MPNELPYRIWHDLKPHLTAAEPTRWSNDWGAVRQLLEPHRDGTVYATLRKDGSLYFGQMCLWTGEATAYRTDRRRPRVTGFSRGSPTDIDFATVAITIGDHLGDDEFLEGLCKRLRCLSDYDPALLPNFPDWLWLHRDGKPCNILVGEDARVIEPPTKNSTWMWSMPNPQQCAPIIDGEGCMGLLASDGRLALPCRFAYLSGWSSMASEAAEELMPLPGGLCDLIDLEGRRLNPPGIKALAGSFGGRIGHVVREADGPDGVRGFIGADGALLGDIRWRKVKGHDYLYGIAVVQDGSTGLWGHVDEHGKIVAEPQYAEACSFYHFGPVRNQDGLWGAVDKTGKLVVPMVWHQVETLQPDTFAPTAFKVTGADGKCGIALIGGRLITKPIWDDIKRPRDGYFIVHGTDKIIGLIDAEGKTIIAPHRPEPEVQEKIERCSSAIRFHPFNEFLNSKLREQVAEALLGSDTLAPIAGMLPKNPLGNSELIGCGLWGRSVTVIADSFGPNRWPMRAGDTGTIGWSYPASASVWDLTKEAPVEGLKALPHGSVGVPWNLLRFAEVQDQGG